MNANYRRDYLYQMNTGKTNGCQEGMLLRYLKYDRKTKEYVFIEGDRKTTNEVQIRLNHASSRLKKLHCIGYEETDQYIKGVRLLDIKREKAKQQKELQIHNTKALITGKTYLFSELDGVYIHNKPLTLLAKSGGGFVFSYDTDGRQYLPDFWINKGLLKCVQID